MSNARDWLFKRVEEYRLSPSLCGLPEFDNLNVTIEEHQENIQRFMDNFHFNEETFVLMGQGRNKGEKSLVYVKQGMYKGFGFVKKKLLNQVEDYLKVIDLKPDTIQVRSILKSVLRNESQQEYEIKRMN